ncbi:MAG TPA: hypothetical protein VGC14_04205 [Rhizobium sp.]
MRYPITFFLASLVPFGAIAATTQPEPAATFAPREDQAVTEHVLRLANDTLAYRATAGTLLLRAKTGEPRATMFYVAYERTDQKRDPHRPVTFFFNGGPGSATLWLHLGSFGPHRLSVPAPDQTGTPAFGPNPYTLLDRSDLVFLDAVGTGYSRTLNAADNKAYWGNDEDADSFAEAIGRYLTVSGKWDAPKLLFGESYGTMRAAMLANRLEAKGIAISGIVMMSSILNFAHFAPGLDRASIDLLPTYAATALYHGRIPPYPGGVEGLTRDARVFAGGSYAQALAQGDLISDADMTAVATRFHNLTGLSVDYIKAANLRIGIDQFRRELLRDKGESVGALDTRFEGAEGNGVGERASYDPAEAQLSAPYTETLNHYLADELHYRPGIPYIVSESHTIMGQWDWSHQPPDGDRQGSLADAVPDLASAMRRDPKLKILSVNGWYDVMTPFFGTEFDLAHLWAGPATSPRITMHYYPSGHMLYVDDRIMPQLRKDIGAFYDQAVPK